MCYRKKIRELGKLGARRARAIVWSEVVLVSFISGDIWAKTGRRWGSKPLPHEAISELEYSSIGNGTGPVPGRKSKELAWPSRSRRIVGDEIKWRGQITHWPVGHCVDVGFNLRQMESVEVTWDPQESNFDRMVQAKPKGIEGEKRNLKEKRLICGWVLLQKGSKEIGRGCVETKVRSRKKLLLP